MAKRGISSCQSDCRLQQRNLQLFLQLHCWVEFYLELIKPQQCTDIVHYNNGAIQLLRMCRYCCRTRWSWQRPLATCCCARAATPPTPTTTRTLTGSSWAVIPTLSLPPAPAPSGRSAGAARSAPCTKRSPRNRHCRTSRPGEDPIYEYCINIVN